MNDNKPAADADLRDAYRRLRAFRRGETAERLFVHPTCHPAEPTGFCYCEGSLWQAVRFWTKAIMLGLVFRLPSNGLKVWMLRRLGARVGRGVYFSPGVWIDPMFPELIAIDDGVFFGMDAKLLTHEFRIDEFRAGKVHIERQAFIGAFSIVCCGVEIGERAIVGACAVAFRDVPAGASLVPYPPTILPGREKL